MSSFDNALGLGTVAAAAYIAIAGNDEAPDGSNGDNGTASEVKVLTVESMSDGVCIYQISADNIQELASTESVSGTGFIQDAVAPNSPVDAYTFQGELTIKADYPERAEFEVTSKSGVEKITPDPLEDGIIEV